MPPAGRRGSRRLRVRLRDGLSGSDHGRGAVDVLLRRQVAEQRLEAVRVDRLLSDELVGQGYELVAMGREDLGRPLVRLVDDRADLVVDGLGDLVAVVLLLDDLAAEVHYLVLV